MIEDNTIAERAGKFSLPRQSRAATMPPVKALAYRLAALGTLCTLGCRGGAPETSAKPLPIAAGDAALLTPGPRSPRIANYRIDVDYDAEARRITGKQQLTWKNTGVAPVSRLPFHLYLNAFKNELSVFMQESRGRHRRAKASKHWGWIDVTKIAIGDSDKNLRDQAAYVGPDETVLEIPLADPIEPGATVTVHFEFTSQLPEVFARTGYKGEFAMVGQWFPKIGVLQTHGGEQSWHCEPFHVMSEFFADFGTYDVSLTVPSTHVVAASGVLVDAQDAEDGRRTLTYRAEDVHDFAWMIDPHMQSITGQAKTEAGNVEVEVYFRPEQRAFAERHLRAGIGAIEIFSRMYVPYPWRRMTIVDPPIDAASGAGGMEYPTIVTTAADGALSPPGVLLPEFVTVHEVGHNWFQGLLASNEVDEAWLDEGINEYADGIAMAELYGEATSAIDWHGIHMEFYRLRQALSRPLYELPDPIATPSHEFADARSYGTATYSKTALAMRSLENIYGEQVVRAAMRKYATSFAFSHPTGSDLFAVLEREIGEDLSWFTGPAFKRTGAVDYRVRGVNCRHKRDPRGVFGDGDERRQVDDTEETEAWLCDVTVVNLGEVPVPTEVEFEFADGSRSLETWNDRTRWHRFELERSSELVSVTIDPRNRVLLNDSGLDRDWRKTPDPAAARRAGARTAFWTQSLMQVFGL